MKIQPARADGFIAKPDTKVRAVLLYGPDAGLELINSILDRQQLVDYHLTHAARAELCRRAGRLEEALAAYELAMTLVRQEPERRFLARRLSDLRLSLDKTR